MASRIMAFGVVLLLLPCLTAAAEHRFWLTTSLVRVFPNTTPRDVFPPLPPGEGRGEGGREQLVIRPHPNPLPEGEGTKTKSARIDLLTARHARTAFQACVRNESTKPLGVECKVIGADDLRPQVRLVGLVPMHHLTPHTDPKELDGVGNIPGLVPDPLMPTSKASIGPFESRSFWITLNIPTGAKPGPREFKVQIGGQELPIKLDIAELVIQPPTRRGQAFRTAIRS